MRVTIRRRLGLIVFGVVLGIVLLEVALQGAAMWTSTLTEPHGLGLAGHSVVLCAGDSHTWGGGRGFPARLSERLRERSERFRVINLGVPGTSTSQLRRRFSDLLDRYHPQLVVLWAGVNNSWNRAESGDAHGVSASLLDRALSLSRIVRFFRVWRSQAALRALLDDQTYVTPETTVIREGGRVYRGLKVAGAETRFEVSHRPDAIDDEAVEQVAERDFRAMVDMARERGIPVVLLTYPIPGGAFAAASAAVRRAAAARGAHVVNPGEGVGRIQRRATASGTEWPKLFDASVHPTQPLYDEIGDMVLEAIDEHELLVMPGARPATTFSKPPPNRR